MDVLQGLLYGIQTLHVMCTCVDVMCDVCVCVMCMYVCIYAWM